MPNWTYDKIYVFSRDGDDYALLKFYLDMCAATSGDYDESEFKEMWWGNLYLLNGYEIDKHEGGFKDEWISCRASISNFETVEDENSLFKFEAVRIDSESAWNFPEDSFRRLMDEKYPNLDFVYLSEEPGCDCYINTDIHHKYIEEKWCVDPTEDDIQYYYYHQFDLLADYIEELTGVRLSSEADLDDSKIMLKVVKGYKKAKGEDAYINIHTYTC